MRGTALRIRRYRMSSGAIRGAALACGVTFGAACAPVSAQEVILHPASPASVLGDPLVQRCRLLAARRADPKLDAMSTAVENAVMFFKLEPVFDAVATCRA